MSGALVFVGPFNPPVQPEVYLLQHSCCSSPSCSYPGAGSRRKAF